MEPVHHVPEARMKGALAARHLHRVEAPLLLEEREEVPLEGGEGEKAVSFAVRVADLAREVAGIRHLDEHRAGAVLELRGAIGGPAGLPRRTALPALGERSGHEARQGGDVKGRVLGEALAALVLVREVVVARVALHQDLARPVLTASFGHEHPATSLEHQRGHVGEAAGAQAHRALEGFLDLERAHVRDGALGIEPHQHPGDGGDAIPAGERHDHRQHAEAPLGPRLELTHASTPWCARRGRRRVDAKGSPGRQSAARRSAPAARRRPGRRAPRRPHERPGCANARPQW